MISRTRFESTRAGRRFGRGQGLGLGLGCLLLGASFLHAGPSAAEAPRITKSATPSVVKSFAKSASVEKGQQAMHFSRYGKGPAVLFLHDLGGDSSVFIDEMQRLEATHTVLLVDLPGHGQSKAAPPHIELPAIAQKVADLIAAQKLGQTVIVGHALGGMLAGYVALADKTAVRGVVAIDAMFAPYPIPQDDLEKLRFNLGRDQARALRVMFGAMSKDARQLDKIVAGAWRVTGQTLVSYLDFASERGELGRRVGEIAVPVHVMATPLLTENQSDPTRIQQALGQVGYAGIANLSYDYFPNAKHWIFWDDPQGFHDSLERFLRRVEGPQPVAVVPSANTSVKKVRPLARAPQ